MRYSTGELAKMMGLTNEGVRYMEKMGIVHSVRDEANGYRWFEYDNSVRLKRTKGFRALGFTLEESRQMLDGELSLADTEKLYAARQAELEERKRELEVMEEDLTLQTAAIRMVEAGEKAFRFAEPDPAIFCPRKRNGEAISYPAPVAEANNLWAQAIPKARMFAVYYANGEEEKGSILTVKAFEELGLPRKENLINLNPGLCAHGAIAAPRLQRPDLKKITGWIQRQGKTATGDVYCIMRLSVRGDDGDMLCVHEFYAPVK